MQSTANAEFDRCCSPTGVSAPTAPAPVVASLQQNASHTVAYNVHMAADMLQQVSSDINILVTSIEACKLQTLVQYRRGCSLHTCANAVCVLE
jgi:hypothetical protein